MIPVSFARLLCHCWFTRSTDRKRGPIYASLDEGMYQSSPRMGAYTVKHTMNGVPGVQFHLSCKVCLHSPGADKRIQQPLVPLLDLRSSVSVRPKQVRNLTSRWPVILAPASPSDNGGAWREVTFITGKEHTSFWCSKFSHRFCWSWSSLFFSLVHLSFFFPSYKREAQILALMRKVKNQGRPRSYFTSSN